MIILSEYCRNRIGNFLQEKVDIQQGYSYGSQMVIEQSFKLLVKTGMYTPESLRKDILRECDVLLPTEWILEVANG